MERRTSDRVPSRLRVQLEGSDFEETACTADISPGGCQLHSIDELPPGTRLRGQILSGDHVIPFEGDVRWSRSIDEWTPGQLHSASLGVSFDDASSRGRSSRS
jgi:hypothetical protein